MDEQEEFLKVKKAIEDASEGLSKVLEQCQGERRQWDYLIVAVPSGGGGPVSIPMMTSVTPEELPSFIFYISHVTKHARQNGRFMDDRTPEGKPS